MGDYTPRASAAEQSDESVITGGFSIPKHQIQAKLPEPRMSRADELAAAMAEQEEEDANEKVIAGTTRVKTGGRQKGTPNRVQRFDLQKACRIYGLQAVAKIVDIMDGAPDENGNNTASVSEQLAAAREILDRGYGKAKQVTEHSGLDGGDIQTKLAIEFIGQPPIKAVVDAQIEDQAGKTIDMQLETVRVPEKRRPWEEA